MDGLNLALFLAATFFGGLALIAPMR